MSELSQTEFTDEKITRLNRYISRAMQKGSVPAVSLTLTMNGKTIFSRGYGRRDIENRKPATPNTLYGVGSITKSFTSLAILSLEKEGLLKTSSPVTDYLEDYCVDGYAGKTTLSHLMYHSSGIASVNASEIILFRDLGRDTTNIPLESMDDFMEYLNGAASERRTPPGKSFMYWNEGYTMLGKVIEKVSHKPFAQYIRETILDPLGMNRSTFSSETALNDMDHATPYIMKDGELVPSGISDHHTVKAPGGLITSSDELSKYVSLWTGSGHGSFDDRVLKEAVKPRITTAEKGPYGTTHYGYGWFTHDDFLGHKLVQHSGSVGASSGFMGFLEDYDVAISMGANLSESPNLKIGMYALSLFIDDAETDDLPFVKHEKLVEELAGTYGDYRDFSTMVISEGSTGNLFLELKSDEYNISVPIIMEDEGISVYMDNQKVPLEIRKTNDNRTEIFLERHRFMKR